MTKWTMVKGGPEARCSAAGTCNLGIILMNIILFIAPDFTTAVSVPSGPHPSEKSEIRLLSYIPQTWEQTKSNLFHSASHRDVMDFQSRYELYIKKTLLA